MLMIILAAALIAVLFYHFIIKPFHYWKAKGVPQGKPLWIFGDNWGTIFRIQSFTEMVQMVYNQCPGTRYSGMYRFFVPTLVLKDPDLLKQITVKDFDHFTDHRSILPENADLLWSKNLFALKGQKWREMRTILSPSFTSSKMRAMFTLMSECAENFVHHFLKRDEDIITVEMKDRFTRFTNDVIATTAFGIQVDSLENQKNEFYLMGKEATDFTGFWRNMKLFGYILFPGLYRVLKISLFPKMVREFFMNLINTTIKMREEQGIVRPDMIHLLMEARKGTIKYEENGTADAGFATAEESEIHKIKNGKLPRDITNEDIASQALIFFFAGFDAVSSLMCFTSYEMAVNQDIQERLRKEIRDTLEECGGKLTYEGLTKMKYMDMVISESLRKWPNAVAVDRICTKPYTIQPTRPGEKPVYLKEGEVLWLPIFGMHRNPEHFPDPERFDPERFNDENRGNIKPYTYFPFGLGPRNCIGSRFALLEAKAIFFYILLHFQIVPVEKTTIPLKISKKSFNISAEDGFWLGLKRNKIKETNMLMTILGTALVAFLFYYFIIKPFHYWEDKGVPQGKPLWILGDNWGTVFRIQSFTDMVQMVYNQCPGTRYSGMYQFFVPTLVLKDPDLLKQITVKDFDHFTDHRTFIPENADPLWGKNLFALKGQKWREMRTILSPSFTSSKMRAMFALMSECAENFVQHFLNKAEDIITVEMKSVYTRFTNDVIASTAFGVQVDSLENQKNEFYLMGKEATDFSGVWRNVIVFGYFIFPELFSLLKLPLFSKKVREFFMNLINGTIKMREEQGIMRPDMIHLLMEARKGTIKYEESGAADAGFATAQESEINKIRSGKLPRDITNEDIASQALIFFFAGFDGVSSLMCFTSYELALNPDIQERLRKEVRDTLEECGGKLTYEGLTKMKYMDMVVSEVLRKWPNGVAADRICTKPYTIQPRRPDEKPVHLKVGEVIWLPIFGIHRDPEHFPDPERFDPERFNDENKVNIKPYTYFPFGLGPRNCIGSRFALLETKVVLFYTLLHFQIVPVEKTPIPLKISKKSFNFAVEGGIWLGLKRHRI